MEIGVPKEIKNNEARVALTPSGVKDLVRCGHRVFVETGAGIGSGFADAEYLQSGAVIVAGPEEAWNCEMVMKVKEPIQEEYEWMRSGTILFTYLHLAREPELTRVLLDKKITAIAYETVQLDNGQLPLLTPMSEVAGRMSVQVGAQLLERSKGGKGILLGGVPGVKKGKVTIIGGGVVGTNAAAMALGLGAEVTILDSNPARLRELEALFGARIQTLMSNPANLHEAVIAADLAVGAVLIPGAKAPKLIEEATVRQMAKGSVIVDIAIDQGGIFATIDQTTTHDAPVYDRYGVLHYAVANMPGAVPRTSTIALTNVTMPYALKIAASGVKASCLQDPALRRGLNAMEGRLTHEGVALAHGLSYVSSLELVSVSS